MKRPNFFIVGAPKCGTTALSAYLSEHPQIFFCEPKEPHYFADDFAGHRPIKSLDAYLRLFEGAGEQHRAVGEGSVFYLYSSVALENIHRFEPAAGIIVMLRDPVELVSSLHQQYLHALYEDEADLRKAWDLQETRRHGNRIPRLCRQPELLMYGAMGKLARQMERVFSIFPRQQVRVILFDDFTAGTADAYRDTLEFLGVPDDGRTAFSKVNEGRIIRPHMAAVSRYIPVRLRNMVTSMRFTPYLRGIPALADRLMKVPHPRPPMDRQFQDELRRYFRDDVDALARLIGRDLKHWSEIRGGA